MTNYKAFEKLNSREKLKSIKDIKDVKLLKQIQDKTKRKILIKYVLARLKRLSAAKPTPKKTPPKKIAPKKKVAKPDPATTG